MTTVNHHESIIKFPYLFWSDPFHLLPDWFEQPTYSSNKKMPPVERVELTRPVQMMTGVLCAVMEENYFAVTLVQESSTYNVMFPALPAFQGNLENSQKKIHKQIGLKWCFYDLIETGYMFSFSEILRLEMCYWKTTWRKAKYVEVISRTQNNHYPDTTKSTLHELTLALVTPKLEQKRLIW